MSGFSVSAIGGLPMFEPGMSVPAAIVDAIGREGLANGDVIVVAQKIVSKCEGRLATPGDVVPGDKARDIAERTQRDPATLQLILDESAEIMRATPAAVIARHRTGHVLANAGIDASNVGGGALLLWPEDPDASARAIRAELCALTGVNCAVVIADSMGRAWRIGTIGTAIGCAGLAVLEDRRGTGKDLFGRTLEATVIAVADSIAAMGALAMGEGDEGTPVALVRGAQRWVSEADGPGAACGLRPAEQDMFR
jgi:coenzyme F420-0:L-glutamate ligase / coenzyme F420-1:gamma-L-glutamate ligase